MRLNCLKLYYTCVGIVAECFPDLIDMSGTQFLCVAHLLAILALGFSARDRERPHVGFLKRYLIHDR